MKRRLSSAAALLMIVGGVACGAAGCSSRRPPVGPPFGPAGGIILTPVPFDSRPREVVYDSSSNDVLAATRTGLYEVDLDNPPLAFTGITDGAVSDDGQSHDLAPGGKLAARLTPVTEYLDRVELRDLHAGTGWVSLPAKGDDLVLHTSLGHRGGLVMGYRPLEDPLSHQGRWRWIFWSADGRRLGSFDTDRELGFLRGPAGHVVGFRREDRIEIRDAAGRVVRETPGRFRFFKLSDSGRVVLGLDAGDSHFLTLDVEGSTPRRLRFADFVWGFALSRDGSEALVWRRDRTFHFVDTATGTIGPAFTIPLPRWITITSALARGRGKATMAFAFRDESGVAYSRILGLAGTSVAWNQFVNTKRVTATIPKLVWSDDRLTIAYDFDNLHLVRTLRVPGGVVQ